MSRGLAGLVGRWIRRAEAPPIVPPTGWSAPLTTLAAASMSFLAVLTLVAGLAADRVARSWSADLAGLATVRVSGTPSEIETRLARAIDVLRRTPGIAAADAIPEAEQAALLEPWIGDLAGFEGLPAPRLVELRLEGTGPDRAALQAQLDREAPGAVYDDHAVWRGPLAEAAQTVGRIAWLATALVMLAACGMVALAARATLSANLEIVRVIRLIGAEDRFIARAFVRRLALRGLAGGIGGAALALAALSGLAGTGTAAGAAVGLDGPLFAGTGGWLAVALAVPLATAAIAWATARASVRMALRRMV